MFPDNLAKQLGNRAFHRGINAEETYDDENRFISSPRRQFQAFCLRQGKKFV